MRLAGVLLLSSAAIAIVQQQQRPNPTGFGSVLYPGTGGPPPASAHGGFGSVLYPGTGGPPGHNAPVVRVGPPPPVAHPAHGRTVIVPYPVYYGGYYSDPSMYSAQALQGDAGSYAAPSQSPVVIINQSFRPDTANPVIRDYTDVPPPGAAVQPALPSDQAIIYLIALTDHTIMPAIAYWVDGDTLNYITAEGNQNRISMSLVDREFSTRLNQDRHVEFQLPAPK
jgi:hypothetical protein